MYKNIISIGIIALGLIIGQTLRKLTIEKKIPGTIPVEKYLEYVQRTVMLGINPLITLSAFWNNRLNDVRLVFLPMLGVFAFIVGGVLGLIASKIFKHDKRQTGAMFCVSSFSNLGSFGGLVTFILLGEKGYAYSIMYRLFEELTYFSIGYPVAKLHGTGINKKSSRNNLIDIITDPFVLFSIIGILIGTLLNVSGIVRPAFFAKFNEVFIPLSTFLLVITVGFKMRINAIRGYLGECITVSAIKFLILPVLITSLAYLLGLGSINDGLVLKTVLVMSAMPPAIYSLIPSQLYGLDIDLANSCWLVGTGLLFLVVPILFVVQGFI